MKEMSHISRLTSVQAVGFANGKSGINIVLNEKQHLTIVLDEHILKGLRQALDEVEAMLKDS